jgi:hypothetical protein
VQAAADAFADAAAYAYAAAAAEASAEARAFAAASSFASAQASAASAAEALAIAMANATASARAAASALARAEASADATASALGQAFAMANAAANAEATAQTSVRVVPNIETSVRSVIDPECLTPICEEYEPCPPCDGEDVPQTTPPDSSCPKPILLTWEFGEVPANVSFRGSKSLPTEISSTLSRYPIVDEYIVDQTLPPGGTILVDRGTMIGSVSGTFESGRTYSATYLFLDAGQCPLIELTIIVTTPGGSGDIGTPTPPTQTQPPTRACMTVAAVYEVPGFLFFPATITEIATTIILDGQDERMTPFQFCATDGTRVQFLAGDTAEGPNDQQAPFARWEKHNPDQQTWETVSEKPLISVLVASGASYRAVFSEQPTWTVVPPTGRQQVCLDVSSVFMYQSIPTTTAYTEPRFVTEPITAQIRVDDVTRTSPFQLCGESGTEYLLIPEAEHWTAKEDHLEFWKWQRYVPETEIWQDIVYFTFGNVEPGRLSVTLQTGGRLRAVYRQYVSLY